MQYFLTVRLSNKLNKGILEVAKRLYLKRSDVIRIALEKFLEDFQEKETNYPYSKVKNLIGTISSGTTDLGENHRKYLLKKFKKNG
jgi:Arc/MetJ-type ribon-helix-helix transcriptional regulator